MKKLVWIAVSLAITVGGLAYALARVDLPLLAHELSRAEYWVVLPFMVLLAAYYLLTAFNWILFLRPLGRFTMRQVLPPMMIGFGGNNLFPARLGELARTVVFARQFGRPTGGVLITVMLERLLDLFAILVFYLIALAVVPALPDVLRRGATLLGLLLIPVCLGLASFLWAPQVYLRLWLWLSRWLPEAWRQRGTRLLQGMQQGLTTLHSLPRLGALAAIALTKWFLAAVMVWLAVVAFNVPISLGAACLVLAVIAIAIALPSAPGFVGPMQAAFVFALTPFGVSPEVAFASSVFYLVANWIPATLAGVVSFSLLGLKLGDLRRQVAQAEHDRAGG